MAITALYSAATVLRALSQRIDVVANNLANAETTAFKRSRTNFEDLYYLALKQPGTTSAQGDVSPAGIYVGLGVRVSNTQLDTEQGSLESTGRQLDVGISGQGFFKVKVMDSLSDGFGYTRNGNFFVNKDGELVLGMGDGYRLEPKINIPKGVTDVSISQDGRVEVVLAGANGKRLAGQVMLHQFVNPEGLNFLKGSLFTQTEVSGSPSECKPGEDGAGEVLQGFLEASNVDTTKERLRIRFLENWRKTILKAVEDVK